MKRLSPAQIAEDAIGLFMERLSNIENSGWDALDCDAIDRAKSQVISEVAEGTEVILPHEVQRVEAAGALLAACKTALRIVENRSNFDFMDCTAILKAAIAMAETLPPAPSPVSQEPMPY